MTVTTDQIQSLYDATVVDSDGTKVGGVGQVYLDDQSGEPSWVTAKTGLFGTSETFVPLKGANISGDEIRVPYTKDFIKDAPNIDGENHLDDGDQGNLFKYYSLGDAGTSNTDTGDAGKSTTGTGDLGDRSADRSGTADVSGTTNSAPGGGTAGPKDAAADLGTDRQSGRPAAGDTTGGSDSVVRREEELRVGKETVESGRLRIRKHVVTENRTVTVPVDREEVEVVREPITDGGTGGTLGDDEVEVTLHEERPVVDKQVVDKERIGVKRSTVTDQREVSADLQREEVEIQQDGLNQTDGQALADGQQAGKHADGTEPPTR